VFESEELGCECFDEFDGIATCADYVALAEVDGVDVCEVEGGD